MRTTLLVVVMSSSLAWADVMFSAPPALREKVAATLKARGVQAIDASEIDDALFGNGRGYNAKAVVAKGDLKARLPERLPATLRADFDLGLGACRQRLAKNPRADGGACAEELVEAVWERHLERVHPERMIELRDPHKQGAGFVIEAVVYEAGSTSVSGGLFQDATVEALIPTVVRSLLDSKPEVLGLRPNNTLLPGEVAAPAPKLTEGKPQALSKLELPAGCSPAETITVLPANAPLASTIATLWKSTVAGHVNPAAQPLSCTLSFEGRAGGPQALQFHWGSSVTWVQMFKGTRFADDAFQASAATAFAGLALGVSCQR